MLKRIFAIVMAGLVGGTLAVAAPQTAHAEDTIQYTQPGDHLVNGRYWKTSCEKYSDTVVRCRTDIWASKVVTVNGTHVLHDGWTFNNLTYLPSDRSQWTGNPLGTNRTWTAQDGRQWRTECDNATTGRNGCRSYTLTSVTAYDNGRFVTSDQWQFNNIVQFTSAGVAPVTQIPAPAPALAGVPVETQPVVNTSPVQTCRASYYSYGSRTANGERYNPDGLTAAHRTLPFGTRVLVTNAANGQTVTVRINDRGPFVHNRCMDLSRGAMTAIGGISAGVITINYQVIR